MCLCVCVLSSRLYLVNDGVCTFQKGGRGGMKMYSGVGGGSDIAVHIPIGTLASVCCSVGGGPTSICVDMLLYLHTLQTFARVQYM